jgi:hypothetical protein
MLSLSKLYRRTQLAQDDSVTPSKPQSCYTRSGSGEGVAGWVIWRLRLLDGGADSKIGMPNEPDGCQFTRTAEAYCHTGEYTVLVGVR